MSTGAVREILVTGADGQLGIELARRPCPAGWRIVAMGRAALDLSDPASIAAAVASRPWAAVINAGAYTAVDAAESDVVAAWTINAIGPAALAAACHASGIPLVHVSTDYVFDGSGDDPWPTDAPIRPLGVYGASKAGGEFAVTTGCPRHAIIRTSWVVSAHRRNFVKTMLALAADRDTLRVVADQHGAPTAAADLADALMTIAVQMADTPDLAGTWHFANAGETDWASVAREIFARSAMRGGPSASVEPIATSDYPTPAARPANSRLSLDTLERDLGIVPRAWQDALDDILDELLGGPA